MNAARISVIIPTLNEERRLRLCLDRLTMQDYHFDQFEIIVVDDGSTDRTRAVAAEYGVIVLVSGEHHIERSKSIGLAAATGEYVLFLDADVQLVELDWVRMAVAFLERFPQALGVQGAYWRYDPEHSSPNRYCELLGVNDPLAYFLGKRGIFHPWEKTWMGVGERTHDDHDATVVRFASGQLPTLGSQGFLTRRKQLLNHAPWQPYFFHLEAAQALYQNGFHEVIFLKRAVEHDYVRDWFHFYKKLYRNGSLFLQFQEHRNYSYGMDSFRFYGAVVAMLTIVIPLVQAVRGYVKKPDRVWMWHPIACLVVPILYGMVVIHWHAQKIWNRVFRGQS